MYRKSASTKAIYQNKHFLPGLIAGVFLMATAYYSFNSIMDILDTREQIQNNEIRIEQLVDRLDRLEELRGGELEDLEELVVLSLPSQKPIFESLRVVNTIAEETELDLTNLESRPGSLATPSASISTSSRTRTRSDRPNFDATLIELNISGGISSINDFLGGLLETLPLMEMQGVRISSSTRNAGEEGTQFSAELGIESYWQAIEETSVTGSGTARINELTSNQMEIIESLSEKRSF